MNTLVAANANGLANLVFGPDAKTKMKHRTNRTDVVGRINGLGKVRIVVTEENEDLGFGVWGPKGKGSYGSATAKTFSGKDLAEFANKAKTRLGI